MWWWTDEPWWGSILILFVVGALVGIGLREARQWLFSHLQVGRR